LIRDYFLNELPGAFCDRLLSHTVQMLPGAEFMKAVNPAQVKGNSFRGKLLAADQEILKVLK
jgi:hypothetical protein